jgi:heat shock protein HtpX
MSWVILGAGIQMFWIVLASYIVSIAIALSPMGETILRVTNHVRKIETKKEKNYLMPIYEDVYTEAMNIFPNLRTDIELCIVDVLYINAFALGRKTVAVTKGAINSLSEEELKGFIAHELGHILHGDTKALLLAVVGNGIFTILTIILQILVGIFTSMTRRGYMVFVIRIIFQLILWYLVNLGQVILSINSRGNEYRADRFAYEIGQGDNLKEALYLLQNISMSENRKLLEKLKSSHPHIAKRIGRLETMLDSEDEEN